jgi:ABC-type lipoprotein export system ATPase subunit
VNGAALDVRGVSRRITQANGEPLTILDEVSLTVAGGESVAVVGRSGSGKTTLLSLMGLLSVPTSGQVLLWGTVSASLTDRGRARLRSLHLGFVFQSYSLVPHLSAAQNVALPCSYGPTMSRRQIRTRVGEMLDAVGLSELGARYPRHLSGGEQQRVAIARALVRRPGLILADEPTGALDPDTAGTVLRLLSRATADQGCALVLVTHDQDVAALLDRTVRLVAGRVVDLPPDAPAAGSGTVAARLDGVG